MLPVTELSKMVVMFATPCFASQVSSPMAASMYSLAGDCYKIGLNTQWELYSESLITRSRNHLLVKFLMNPVYTHLFWIDADIFFNSLDVFRLLALDKDVLAALYPIKQINWPKDGITIPGMSEKEFFNRTTIFPFFPVNNESDEDGVAEVVKATTGFMVIKRQVILDMMQFYPEMNYVPDGPLGAKDPLAPYHWLFFDCRLDKGRHYLSEDYSFSQLWYDMGRKVLVDLETDLAHLGQYLFRASLTEQLRIRSEG